PSAPPRCPFTLRRAAGRPRQPVTGRPNLATSRSVNSAPLPCSRPSRNSRASRTGRAPRRTSTRAPGGGSTLRRPSHHRTPPPAPPHPPRPPPAPAPPPPRAAPPPDTPIPPTASTDHGETTIGPANSAWALIGTSSSASTSGQTIGPPAENAYAVDPVGVAQTTPSPPHRDRGRSSISVTTSIIRRRAGFSTLASFSAHVLAAPGPRRHTATSI